ncbi:branched-chain amino acid aminotransferase [Bacillus sp. EB106-08-02-XG196]|uniref:branched-chain amino acid aminotransferase n=1 Tax=Bacillus sp. EB106-08-02-XG196 TaxID=2737049 RepID=UPI0015C457C4|nr:branched-chain amino acid aminotransferase [Bacillus sp. EB106-08-02-XG196]NWQ44361.1 branched-chain amino acid aminotransferase [Bacillus sp. EB106-08-02-XG196]
MENKENGNFTDAYIERCSKETETMIANESSSFLKQPITYLKEHKNEFIYVESTLFEQIGVEGVSLEVDDVFGTYDVMLGLKLQKKYEKMLKDQLNNSLQGDEAKFDLMFSHDDGLWDLNFALNYVDGYTENLSIHEAFQLIHQFLNTLVHTIKQTTS